MVMKYAYLIALLVAMLVLGCVSTTTNTSTNSTNSTDSARAVQAGNTVDVDYTGSFENGTVFDTSVGREPLQFVVGTGQMIPGFDSAVIGMHVGEEKNITLQPNQAYGEYNQSRVKIFPRSSLPNNTKAGDTVYAGTMPVKVISLNSTNATIDLNHPLAGKILKFWIKLDKIS